jgi:hypothetical protein
LASARSLRPLAAATPAVGTILFAWSLLERPVSWGAYVALGLLSLVPALPLTYRARVAAAAGVALAALALAFETWPHRALERAWAALHDAPAVQAPFDPLGFPTLHGLVACAGFAVALAAVLGVVARRPTIVVAAVAVGVGFPATLLEDAYAFRLGMLALGSVLWAFVVLRSVRLARTLPGVALAAIVVVSASAAASGGVAPGDAHVDWRGWDPFARGGGTGDFRFVWDANYSGISFPARPTVVFRVRAPKRAQYWRASTLDTFVADRWIENLYPVDAGTAHGRVPSDPLVPPATTSRELAPPASDDRRLRGRPCRRRGRARARRRPRAGSRLLPERGRDPGRDAGAVGHHLLRLELRAGAGPAAPSQRRRRAIPRPPTATWSSIVRRFRGTARRDAPAGSTRCFTTTATCRSGRIGPCGGMRADHRARRSPYEATLRLERWFRSDGNFTYDERPPRSSGLPPLVDFVERTHAGYCQHFAGAMTVMLRMLGVPARVAVGFTAGTWKGGVWTVTDYQAHAWVEAWFAGYGWLTFDPTPGGGRSPPRTRSPPTPRTPSGRSAPAASSTSTRPARHGAASADAGRRRRRAEARGRWWIFAIPVVPLAAAGSWSAPSCSGANGGSGVATHDGSPGACGRSSSVPWSTAASESTRTRPWRCCSGRPSERSRRRAARSARRSRRRGTDQRTGPTRPPAARATSWPGSSALRARANGRGRVCGAPCRSGRSVRA